MKKIILLLLTMLLSMAANAFTYRWYEAKINGIYYVFSRYYDDYGRVSMIEAEVSCENISPDQTYAESDYSGNVIIPKSVYYDGHSCSVVGIFPCAFYGCKDLISVTIPNSVTTIGRYAFKGCSSLTSITIPNSVYKIGSSAFYGTAWYDNQPDGLVYAGKVAYKYKGTMPEGTEITFKEGTLGIADYAFSGCSGLTSITIPNSVMSINRSGKAFYGCSGLTSVTIESSGIVSADIYSSAADLSPMKDLFGDQVKTLIIGEEIKTLGRYMFNNCSALTSVTIGSSVSSIHEYAFSNCSNLKDVYCYAENVPWTSSTSFENTNLSSATLHVPRRSLSLYQTALRWSDFGEILPITTKYHLTYILEDEVYKSYEVEYNASITPEPEPVPIKEGYMFSGWNGLPATMPAHDVVVNGSFVPRSYTLKYMVDGNVYKTYTVAYGSTITPIPAPTKEGHTFSGWSYIPPTMPASDVVVMGSFTVNNYTLTYEVDGQVYKTYTVSYGTTITPEPEPTKEGYTFSGWSTIPATMPARNVTITGTFTKNILGTCATPTISYTNGELKFNSETEGVTFHYSLDIEDDNIKSGLSNKVQLSVTYHISVYATMEDYYDSEVATGTLCWIDQQPNTEGIIAEDAITEVKALPVLIQSNGGTITVQGTNEGTEISVYSVNGMKQGSAIATNGFASINTSLQPDSTAIVKIGEKAIKVLIK